MSTGEELKERMRWVTHHRRLSRSGWSKAAGLSASVVSQIITERLDPRRETLERLAEAADVSPQWLITGKGGPELRDAHYPSRDAIVVLLREREDCPPSVIKALESIVVEGGDPGHEWWREMAINLMRDARYFDALAAESEVLDDE